MAIIPAVCILSGQLVLDQNSAILKGAQVYTYAAETTAPRTVFQDWACTVAHPNPIKVNAYGRIPPIYVDVGDYKVVIKSAASETIQVFEHLPGGQLSASSTSGSTTGAVTGDLKAVYGNTPQDGWLIANGGTIGNGNSSATARANDDAFNLFVALWNADPNLVVTPSKGASATLDWQASKTIALPDFRGRVLVGCDKMGAPLTAGRLTSATTATPDQVGATFGTETTALSVAQLPTFTPNVTMGAAGAHGHTASADVQGYHAHGGGTTASGDHAHSYTAPGVDGSMGGGSNYGRATGPYGQGTGGAGNHARSIATDGQGSHSHNISVAAAPNHVHTLAVSPIGSGAAHANMPPAILIYWQIRL